MSLDYLRITGTWQNWYMFTAVPRYHRNRFHIEATTHDGRIVNFDPVLPGLRPVDRDFRNTMFLTRVLGTLADMRSEFRSLRRPYFRRVCRAIERSGVERPRSVALVHEATRITPPLYKSNPTEIGRDSVIKTDPFPCS